MAIGPSGGAAETLAALQQQSQAQSANQAQQNSAQQAAVQTETAETQAASPGGVTASQGNNINTTA